ncbi:conserved hypothetical protein (plasmid) [Thioalkalivibrio sp. K90mix]|uniref:hypothetical protein n=1 Tax=Thioalkalivibrio sp. (strain K90mix) TaxID=396595 RepID=UPI000195A3BB|nr:hypothetical protein [Thioalkalivibrio sp. K90mix]ADC73157.1 conserved hypothetical protein [Thioalkalivibrio sp. K90mix]
MKKMTTLLSTVTLTLLLGACAGEESNLSPEAQELKDSMSDSELEDFEGYANMMGATLEEALEAEASDIDAGRSDGEF